MAGGNAWSSMGQQLEQVYVTLNEQLSSNKSSWTGKAADAVWKSMSDLIHATHNGSNLFLVVGANIDEMASLNNFVKALSEQANLLDQQIVSRLKLATVP